MVLGLRSKHRKGSSLQVDFIIHVEEVKPWPPSQSLKSVQSVLFVWENGEQNSGSFVSDVGDTGIEFNESITLPVTLCRDKKAQDKFQKNFLDFYLYEPRKDKGSRGQLLGTCVINLADFGATEEAISICTPVNCKKSSKSIDQPSLFITIQSFHRDSSNSPPKVSLSNEKYIDKDGQTSVADSVNEENDDGCEIATFTDDDDESPRSSQNASFSTLKSYRDPPSHYSKSGVDSMNKSLGRDQVSEPDTTVSFANISGRDLRSSDDNSALMTSESSSLNAENPTNGHSSFAKLSERSMTSVHKKSAHPVIESSSSFATSRGTNGKSATTKRWFEQLDVEQDEELLDDLQHFSEIKFGTDPSQYAGRKSNLRSDTLNSNKREHVFQGSSVTSVKTKHSKSPQLNNTANRTTLSGGSQTASDKSPHGLPDRKNESKSKVEMLEEELRETAVLEVSLYSVVAEHASSSNKIHAPARRLSRFYLHACKMKSRSKQASAARAAIAGLVLVSKACGNDVPRLTFWLSNSIMLRAIVSRDAAETLQTNKPYIENNAGKSGSAGRSLKQRNDFSSTKDSRKSLKEHTDWEDVKTFVLALEQLEAWIFSRIVESVWWQTLTPHMQSSVAKTSDKSMISNSKKGRKPGLGDQEQGNFSIELWKNAFKDACERLCPVRAGGHECGCLSLLAKLIMEQLVSRLDVAMFNAILRESADEMPTDPVSDPISDAKVLPIPAGKSSFGAGAQLKNAIGNWSRWLSNLFGIEENDSNDIPPDGKQQEPSKPFRLLNELSDLMMLPFDMVADPQTRKEVCATFSPTLIKRILSGFVPDEFYQKRVPQEVFDALDAEDEVDTNGEHVTSFPCSATPIVYSPPSAASVTRSIGEVGSQSLSRTGSSVLKKSYTSDDELDELDSPLTSITADRSRGSSSVKINWSPKGGKGCRNIVRYQLLREVWRDDEQ
nr:Metal-response element-binding transcription factor 2 like [Ipomoea batatas]